MSFENQEPCIEEESEDNELNSEELSQPQMEKEEEGLISKIKKRIGDIRGENSEDEPFDDALVNQILSGEYYDISELVKTNKISKKRLADTIKKAVIATIDNPFALNSRTRLENEFSRLKKIVKRFNPSKDLLDCPEVQEALWRKVTEVFRDDGFKVFLEWKNEFNLSEEFNQSPEVQRIVREKLLTVNMRDGYQMKQSDALLMKEMFNIPEDEFQEIAKKIITATIEARVIWKPMSFFDEFDKAEVALKRFNPSKEVIESPEVRAVIQKSLLSIFKGEGLKKFLECKKLYHIPEEINQLEDFQQIAKGHISSELCNDSIEDALLIQKVFNISEEDMKLLAKKAIIDGIEITRNSSGHSFRKDRLKRREETNRQIVKVFSLQDEFPEYAEETEKTEEGTIDKLKKRFGIK